MKTQKIKTLMIRVFGEGLTAFLHGIRFAYLLKFCDRKLDPELRILSRFISSGSVAVDVGANGADWTLYLARAVGRGGRIFAFEADPYYARATLAAVKMLGLRQVRFFSFGLSDKDEDVALRVMEDSGQRVSGLGYVDRGADGEATGTRAISLRPLDSLVAEYPELMRTAFLKCDVEGYELFVLRGASRIIQKARPVIVIETGCFQKQGYSERDLSGYLGKYGYKPYALTAGDRMVPVPESLECKDALTVNRIFVPDERKNILNMG